MTMTFALIGKLRERFSGVGKVVLVVRQRPMLSHLMIPVCVGFFRIPVFPKAGSNVVRLVKNANNVGLAGFTGPSIGGIAGGMTSEVLP